MNEKSQLPDGPPSEPRPPRRAYTKPALVELGSIEELTQGGRTGSPDGGFRRRRG